MKSSLRTILKSLFFLSLFAVAANLRAQGTAFTYQGLLDVSGVPADGNYDLSFQLYDAATTNGTAIGSAVTVTNTPITNGVFTVPLDFGAVFTGTNYWVQIGARTNGSSTYTNLSPLLPINPTPYAIFATGANTAVTATTAATATTATTAVNASNLLGTVPTTQLTGIVPLGQLPAVLVTNGASGVTLSGAFSGDGSGLTNVSASLAGTLSNSSFSGTYTNAVIISNVANVFVGDGSGLSNVTASAINGVIAQGNLNGTYGNPLNFNNPNNTFTGNGAGLTNVTAATAATATTLSGALSNDDFAGTYTNAVTISNSANVFSGTFSGDGTGLTNVQVISNNVTIVTYTTNVAFQGDGSGLTNLVADSLTGADTNAIAFSNPGNTFSGAFTGDGSGLTNLVTGAWNLTGNAGTTPGVNFIGTTDSTPLVLKSAGQTALVLDATESGSQPNIIAGSANNYITNSTGSTIAGGLYNSILASDHAFIGSGEYNFITNGRNSVIGGGLYDFIEGNSRSSVIGGGGENLIESNSDNSTISGGDDNTITNAAYATIPGGFENFVSGSYSFAAGNQAQATNVGAFVWSDNSGGSFSSTNDDSFNVRAVGGVYFSTFGTGMTVDGPVTAPSFVGDGSGLTGVTVSSVPAGNITGTLGFGQLPAGIVTNNETGVVLSGVFSGDGSGLTNIAGTTLGGTYTNAVTFSNSADVFVGDGSGLTNLNITNNNVTTVNYTNSVAFTGDGSGLTNLSAASISGADTNAVAFSNASDTFSGSFTGDGSGLTNVNATNINGTVAAGNLPIATTSTAGAVIIDGTTITITNGVISAAAGAGSVQSNTDNTFAGASTFDGAVIATNDAADNQFTGTVSGNGAGLTNLNAWGLTGNAGTGPGNFIGTTDSNALVLESFGQAALVLDGTENSSQPNIIAGPANYIANSTGSTIAGGDNNSILAANHAFIGSGEDNYITNARNSVIGGGLYDYIEGNSRSSVIVGGGENLIESNSDNSTIGGGYDNTITNAEYATIPGGYENVVSGSYSFAAGQEAQATNVGAFVWSDDSGGTFSSTNDDSFNVRAIGGVFFSTFGGGMTVDGTVTALSFSGDGSGLTNLSAASATTATSASTAGYATNAGTADSATSASTAGFATNAGTASLATSATTAGYATNAGTASFATNATTASLATSATTAGYATNAGTATSATTATTADSATSFSGSLGGDVTGIQGSTVVALVDGVTAANVASGANAANGATDADTTGAIVARDGSGNFSAGTITAAFSGDGSALTSLNAAQLVGGPWVGALTSGLTNYGAILSSNTVTSARFLTTTNAHVSAIDENGDTNKTGTNGVFGSFMVNGNYAYASNGNFQISGNSTVGSNLTVNGTISGNGAGLTNITGIPTSFATTNINVTDGTKFAFRIPHGLGHTPTNSFEVWMICTTNDTSTGITVGQQLESRNLQSFGAVDCPFTAMFDSTYVYISYGGQSGTGFNVPSFANGGTKEAFTSFSNFQIQVVCQ